MIAALAAFIVLGADGGVPQVLVSRQLLVQMYVPIERETWTLWLDGSNASLRLL